MVRPLLRKRHLLQAARDGLEVVVGGLEDRSGSAQNRIVVPVFLVVSPCLRRVPGTEWS